ncbi:MAG: hypothetical protein H0V31_11430 [Acidobacteria bacterium]|nr:hypothetical protein [Acidobacteriota bacterium]
MRISPTKLCCVFILSIFLFNGCGKNENSNINQPINQTANNDNANIPKDDVEELERIIKLPFHPEEATWRETDLETKGSDNRVPAANGKKLTVVLKFSAEDANKIIEQAEKYKPAAASDVDAEDWFPAELIAQSQLSGDENLKGKSFVANDFLQPPYVNGKITRISNTDYFVLELTSF